MSHVIAFALRQRFLMLALFLFLCIAGVINFVGLNIEAYPDPVPPMVDIVTQSPGQSAEEIERYVTVPIEVQTTGIPNLAAIRSVSLFGLSDVKLQFTYGFTYYEAEQWVINRLSQLAPLPNGAQPQLSPESPVGEIYRYRVVGPPGYSVTDLKTIEDWILERRFKAVPGVIDVTGWGGKTKTYDVSVDLDKLVAHGLTLQQVVQQLNASDLNVGGGTLNLGPQAAVVRGVALIHSMDDVRDTVLATPKGVPVLLRDVATVSVGNRPRLGIAGQDRDDDVVEGIVLMRRGAQSLPTLRRVEAEVARINATRILPPGVRIERIYDRTQLIRITTRTVLHNLLLGIVLIFLVQWTFLGNLRSALVVSATIPFALFFAVTIMVLRGESANLLSVGAIDFGLIVDATVIMVENVFRHLGRSQESAAAEAPPMPAAGLAGLTGKLAVIGRAAVDVERSIMFSAVMIITSFVPLFTLSGIEGHIFGPMAKTYAYAIAGGLLATYTVTPALSALLLPSRVNETETRIVRALRRAYRPALGLALAHRGLTLSGAGLLLVMVVLGTRILGLEFLPKLEEGNLWIRASMPQSISLEEGDAYVNRMRRTIEAYPEVVTVISQHGRPDDGTDATGFFNTEFFVPLKPFGAWPHGVDKAGLTAELNRDLEASFPGVSFNFSQYIEDNVEEAASGVKGENSVKLYGNDLAVLQRTAERIKEVMSGVPGITDLAVFNSLGQPTVRVGVDRLRAARYGLTPRDINSTLAAALGGQDAGNLYEEGSDRHFPTVVRLAPQYRGSLDAIRNLAIGAPGPNGTSIVQVPLSEVASVELVSGPSFIYRQDQQRYLPVKFSVRGRDLGSAVLEAQQKVAREVRIPSGYRLDWVGEFGELQEALARLAVVVPLTLALIGMLLFINFSSLRDTLLAASVLPMALVGGIFALLLTGTPFSVSAAIGFIALFGVSAMDGILVLSYFNRLIDMGVPRAAAIVGTCEVQMRPVMMTCVVACVGLLPAALSTGIGSQVQKPLALVVVGGILLAPVLILILLPVLIDVFSHRGRSAAPVAE